jgi:hypothetical protein
MSALTFHHDGERYRIVFEHSRAHDWDAHKAHPIGFDAIGSLVCLSCSVVLTNVGPLAARTFKKIAGETLRELHRLANGMNAGVAVLLKKRADAVERLMGRELARYTTCRIEKYVEGEWRPTGMAGRSKLNTDAGDKFTREGGRIAALRDALPKRADPMAERNRESFVVAAMVAYRGRFAAASDKTRKAGGL